MISIGANEVAAHGWEVAQQFQGLPSGHAVDVVLG
jgi:hypothetical protein